MSWQAMEAVYDRSSIRDPHGRSVLLAIARHMNGEGIVGNCGRHTAPTQARYIEHACVTASTFQKWVKTAVAAGELQKITHGSGRGAWCEYRLLLLNDPPQRSLDWIDDAERSTPTIVPVDRSDEPEQIIDPPDAIIDPMDAIIDLPGGSNTKDTKDTEEKQRSDNDALIRKVGHVIDRYRRHCGLGRINHRPSYADEWVVPVNSLLQHVQWDTDRAIDLLLEQHAEAARTNRPYWPDSVVPKIVASLIRANRNGHHQPSTTATALEIANAQLAKRRAALGEPT